MNGRIAAALGFLLAGIAIGAGGSMSGTGTSASPYLIEDYADLKQVSNDLTASYRLANTINAAASSGENSGQGMLPIGSISSPFTGSFDGASYRIHGLKIASQGNLGTGLFGATSGTASITKLVVDAQSNGDQYVGILVGYNQGSIQQCGASGSATGITYVGGAIGFNLGTVTRSFSATSVKGYQYVGGFVGGGSGSVQNSYSHASVIGISSVGGFVGIYQGGTYKYDYSAGRVVGESNAGGFLGSGTSGSYTRNYWDAEKSGQTGTTIFAVGKTTSEMQDSSLFLDWDFTTTWEMGADGGYPKLRSLPNPPQGEADHVAAQPDTTDLSEFLVNDLDQQAQGALVVSWMHRSYTLPSRDSLALLYRPGVVVASGDTIWGAECSIAFPWSHRDISTYEDLIRIGNHSLYPLDGVYRLTADIDASPSHSQSFTPIGSDTLLKFQGRFSGNGYVVRNLSIDAPNTRYVGLFAIVGDSGSIDSVTVYGHIRGGIAVGGLVGQNQGTLVQVGSHVQVEGDSAVGGLIGGNHYGSLIRGFATGDVYGIKSAGGLIGSAYYATDSVSFASGAVRGTYFIGGLIGKSFESSVSSSYSTGVSIGEEFVGGLVGYKQYGAVRHCYSMTFVRGYNMPGGLIGASYNSTITASYWNLQASTQSESRGGTLRILDSLHSWSSYAGWDDNVWTASTDSTLPGLQGLPNAPVAIGEQSSSLPDSLAWSQALSNDFDASGNQADLQIAPAFSLKNIAQDSLYVFYRVGRASDSLWGGYAFLSIAQGPIAIADYTQLRRIGHEIDYPLDGNYILTQNIDAAASAADNDNAGFDPIGSLRNPFMGTLNGKGHRITGLTINRSDENRIGLFGVLGSEGSVDSLDLEVALYGKDSVGAVAGVGLGSISAVHAEVRIEGRNCVGGLVGTVGGSGILYSRTSGSVLGLDSVGGMAGAGDGTLQFSYNAAQVTGSARVGGLVGASWGYGYSYVYSTGTVQGDSLVGGLIGSGGNVSYAYVSAPVIGKVSVQPLIGQTANSIYNAIWNSDIINLSSTQGTAMTTAKMKSKSNWSNFDFYTYWRMRDGDSYPGLQSQDNLPIAIPDSLPVSIDMNPTRLSANDFDIESAKDLFIRIVKLGPALQISAKGGIQFVEGSSIGATDTLWYRAGETNADGDTVWGNKVSATMHYSTNLAPIAGIDSTNGKEDTSWTMAIASLLANDSDPYADFLEFSGLLDIDSSRVVVSVRGDSLVFTPGSDWNGRDTVRYVVTDGDLTDTAQLVIIVQNVNDAPVLQQVQLASVNSNTDLTAPLAILAATDVDGDTLSFFLQGEDAASYRLQGDTLYFDTSYQLPSQLDTLHISIIVSDGTLSDTADAIQIREDESVPYVGPHLAQSFGVRVLSGQEFAITADDEFQISLWTLHGRRIAFLQGKGSGIYRFKATIPAGSYLLAGRTQTGEQSVQRFVIRDQN